MIETFTEQDNIKRFEDENKPKRKKIFKPKWTMVKDTIDIWHFSDTHGDHRKLQVPKVDVAIFSGDEGKGYSPKANFELTKDFIEWFGSLDIEEKIFVGGNHSNALDSSYGIELVQLMDVHGITYLEESGTRLHCGLTVYGTPYRSVVPQHWSFVKDNCTYEEIEDSDIIVTHYPPYGILDNSPHPELDTLSGDKNLLKALSNTSFQVHLFGHIHDNTVDSYGYLGRAGRTYVNSACQSTRLRRLEHNGHIITFEGGVLTSVNDHTPISTYL